MKIRWNGFTNKISRTVGMWLCIENICGGRDFYITTDPSFVNTVLNHGGIGIGIHNKFFIGVW